MDFQPEHWRVNLTNIHVHLGTVQGSEHLPLNQTRANDTNSLIPAVVSATK